MMRWPQGLAAISLLLSGVTASAWDADDLPLWPDGTIELRMLVGTSPVYSDGSNPNQVGLAAIEHWNPYMGRLQISGSTGAASSKGANNGRNDVFFDSKVYGENYPANALAVTLIRYSGSRRTETDVAVNNTYEWDSYRGFLTGKQELRRVLIHEFGHVLGLDHPDDAGQFVSAVMNSHIDHIDSTVEDDQNGAAALYGRGVANPPVPPTVPDSEPGDQTAATGERVTFSVNPVGSEPFSYQWRKNGVTITAGTHRELVFEAVQLTDAGVYSVVISNEAGSVTSRGATLAVYPAQPPVINIHPQPSSVPVGARAFFSVEAYGTDPLSFQWYKDGQAIEGRTDRWMEVLNVAPEDQGDYWVVVSNVGGSLKSDVARLTVLPLPQLSLWPLRNREVVVGQSFSLSVSPMNTYPGALQYEWYHNGQLVVGANSSLYFVSQAGYDDAGEYQAIVRNATGATTSTVAILEVVSGSTPPPGGWKQVLRANGCVYLLFENPARIERFDLAENAFLPAIDLAQAPTAIAARGDFLYVAFGTEIARMATDGSGQVMIATLDAAIAELAVWNNYLYTIAKDKSHHNPQGMTSIDLTTFAIVDQLEGSYDLGGGISVDETGGHMFFRTTQISPSDIVSLKLSADGTFGGMSDGSNITAYAGATQTYVTPADDRVVENSGTVYRSADLAYVGKVGGRLQDIDFREDGSFVVLRSGRRIDLYSNGLVRLGELKFSAPGEALAVWGEYVYLFSQPTSGGETTAVQRLALSELSVVAPAGKVSPGNLAYTPDGVWLDHNEILLLYSRLHRNIFRWSIPEQRYLESIPLLGSPNFVEYSPEQRRLYLGYADNQIQTIALADSSEETFMNSAPLALRGMAAAGEYLVIYDALVWGSAYFSLSPTGQFFGSRTPAKESVSYVWNANRRRIYHFRDGEYPNDLLYTAVHEDGSIERPFASSSHGEFVATLPIRTSPSGDQVLLGSGLFFNADTLVQTNALPNFLEDAAWLGTTLYTGRTLLAGTEIQRWDSDNFTLDTSTVISGRLIRLLAVEPDVLVVVTMQGDFVQIVLLDADLNVLNHFPGTGTDQARLINISTRGTVGREQNIMIAGFVVSGSATKRVLVRGIGPSLARFDVPDLLPDPILRVFNSAGQPIAINDNWGDVAPQTLRDAFADVYAFKLPDGSADAAVVLTLTPGLYTAHLSGKSSGTGIGLVEIYDLDAPVDERRLINISTRAVVGSGHNALIPGLVISGDRPKRVLIRAVGPSLARFGLSDLLMDPRFEVVSRVGDIVAANDDWEMAGANAVRAAESATSAFALDAGSADAALAVTLSPGSYTVLVHGADAKPGLALVEVYEIP